MALENFTSSIIGMTHERMFVDGIDANSTNLLKKKIMLVTRTTSIELLLWPNYTMYID